MVGENFRVADKMIVLGLPPKGFRDEYRLVTEWLHTDSVECDTFVPGLTVLLYHPLHINYGHFFNDMIRPSWGIFAEYFRKHGHNKELLSIQSPAATGYGLWKHLTNNPIDDLDSAFGNGTRCYEQVKFSGGYFPSQRQKKSDFIRCKRIGGLFVSRSARGDSRPELGNLQQMERND